MQIRTEHGRKRRQRDVRVRLDVADLEPPPRVVLQRARVALVGFVLDGPRRAPLVVTDGAVLDDNV